MKTSTDFPQLFEDKLIKIPEQERNNAGRMLSDLRADELEYTPIKGNFDISHLAKIHKYLFEKVSTHAGVIRAYSMNKGGTPFAEPSQMSYLFDKELPERIKILEQSVNNQEKYIDALSDLHSTLDLAHPFRDGNGRSTRIFMSQLAKEHGYNLDFSTVDKNEWVRSCIDSIETGRETLKQPLFKKITISIRE